jgi:hypothetical protein
LIRDLPELLRLVVKASALNNGIRRARPNRRQSADPTFAPLLQNGCVFRIGRA